MPARPVLAAAAGALLLSAAFAQEPELPPAQTVRIATLPARMLYDVTEFTAPAGARLTVVFENTDDLPHNLVFCLPGEDRGMDVARAAWDLGAAGPKKQWIPDHPRILQASAMAEPHTRQEMTFTVPQEAGVYPYVCTFPGHAMLMNGLMRVTGPPGTGGGLRSLAFRFFLGSFDRLPDFTALTPHRQGLLEEGLVEFRLDDYQENFAVLYSATLEAPRDGTYQFFLASDDGSQLHVDGRPVIDNDGIHGASEVRTGTVELTKGEHALELGYFEHSGEEQLYLAWSGPGFTETALSRWIHPSRRREGERREEERPGIVLAPRDGEPVIYRQFIAGASPRGIGVGYPGGINVVWDAGPMNLALVWRGAFLDAREHWSDRGAGFQKPLGYDLFSPAPGQPLATLENRDAPWPPPAPRAPEFRFRGYRLDTQRRPVFSYRLGDLAAEDRLDPVNDFASPDAGLLRTLTLSGPVPAGLTFRVAEGASVTEPQPGVFLVDERFTVRNEGAGRLLLRAAGERQELLLPLTGPDPEVRILYGWPY